MRTTLPSASTEQYEALRQNAGRREPFFLGAPLGAILVVKNGLAGWMRHWDQVCRTPASPDLPRVFPDATDQPHRHHELAMLLAEMTAPHIQSTSL